MTMKAIEVADDDRGTMHWGEAERPEPGYGQVRISVAATAVNRADLLQRRGLYPVPDGASPILGLEASGTIEAVGEGVSGWSQGQEVCVLLEGGGYAEYVVVDASMLLKKPESVSLVEAAAIPEVFYTAYLNLYMEGRLADGETALVHAGASGVGTAALQLCRAFGNTSVATASGGKLDTCKELGADFTVDRHEQSFKECIREWLDDGAVDVILDPVGGSYLADNLSVLNKRGRLVIIGLLGGMKAEAHLGKILMNRLQIIGSVLRSRSRAEKVEITKEMKERVWPLFDEGKLKPVVDSVLPITDANDAHALLENNETSGKVVLTID
jgi:putative PIG3 family NAD(P)H quinone oxidoreductase